MKRLIVAAALMGAAALPATASGAAYDGSTCNYVAGQQEHVDVGAAHVYADADGGSGVTGQGTVAAGACLDNNGAVGGAGNRADGGTAEAGAGATGNGTPVGVYGIVDGDNDNTDPSGQGDGYIGVSTFETAPPPAAPAPGCGGGTTPGNSNSGGCFGVDNTPILVPGVPVACGNTSGNTWGATARDGCSIP
jgi:hypothetical protein